MSSRVVVSGASGLIGSALVESLRADGLRVVTLVRREARGVDEVRWLTDDEPLSPASLAGASAVVNLNGASIGRLPWTPRYKRTLVTSRLTPTRVLATALRGLGADAPAFVSGSASGFYGDRPGIRHVIDAGLAGPVNLSGPTPATANEVGRAIARELRRPFWLPVPAWALRLGLTRDAADSLLLTDATVSPRALVDSGFEFRHATAASAIEAVTRSQT